MKLGETIRNRRNSLGLSQGYLAEKAGITQTYLCLIEKDKKEPTMDKLKSICDSLEIPLPFLLLKCLDEDDLSDNKKAIFSGIKQSLNILIDSVIEVDSNVENSK